MTSDQRKKLSEIKQFKQLIAYLRDEMGWPIKSESDFDELTYEYTTTELGIDDKSAAQIQEIKRLRPLSAKQPWGVFFVKFEPKKLPVVALRRILGQVALKKRASANPADRTMWAQEDLLFISNYGEGDDRQITLAHFSVPTGGHTLPSLKVLGWDSKDTVLHLEAVARELTEQLSWPDNENDVDAWRAQWRAAFTVGHQEVITTSKALSIRLAQLARDIRDRISTALTIETEDGPLTKLMKAFQESLIHDLTPTEFADMYAQTIAYGLLSSRIADPNKKSVDDLAEHMQLSPFLSELMATFLQVGGRNKRSGLDFDELGVSEVIELLDQANMAAVVADFGDKNPQEDPVIHFYELFLKEYDEKLRMSRGVFYTPRPVVSYIVRSADELLRTEFGLADGLADTATWAELTQRKANVQIPDGVSPDQDFVKILDPATGTGTFLVEVIDQVYKTLVKKWTSEGNRANEIVEKWNDYVPKHLLTRLHGYELLMAPYSIAHLKISLKLLETGYNFSGNKRAKVYLTNSLEPVRDVSGQFEFAIPALANEAREVNGIKGSSGFTIVLGNPPYSGNSSNTGEWIKGLVADYYKVDGQPLGERNPKWLQDDYVKFVRLGQSIISRSGVGILAYITNHGYIANPTFRGMRQQLMQAFSSLRVLDLHGNSKMKEISPDGGADMNVFDIQQGVAILFATCEPDLQQKVWHSDLYGLRESKYAWLNQNTSSTSDWNPVMPVPPYYLYRPQNAEVRDEYYQFTRLDKLFPVNVMGFVTQRDDFAIDFDRNMLTARVKDLREAALSDDAIAVRYGLSDNDDWSIHGARRQLREDPHWESHLIRCSFRPFDNRWCYFSSAVMGRPRRELIAHTAHRENLSICVSRQQATPGFHHAFIADSPANDCLVSTKTREANQVFPMYLYSASDDLGLLSGKVLNIAPSVLQQLQAIGRTAEDFFYYVYALLHSTSYRIRYEDFLRGALPHLPLSCDQTLWGQLVLAGRSLVECQLLRSDSATNDVNYVGIEGPVVSKIEYAGGVVSLAGDMGGRFTGVKSEVWFFKVGGHQVCEKWLKDRKGRALSEEDISHYVQIVGAIEVTLGLMHSIDDAVEKFGGWPAAFES